MLNYSSQREAVEPATEMESPRLDAALDLLADNMPIALCRPHQKNPIGGRWQHKIWTPQEVRRTFADYGDCNVGLRFGPHSGVIDIEIDGDGGEGHLLELFDGEPPPVTPMFTSSRGPHRLFRWDNRLDEIGKEKVRYPNTSGPLEIKLGAGGKGTQSLLPPSIAPDTKGTPVIRRWVDDLNLNDCDPSPLPECVISKLLAKFRPREVNYTGTQAVLGTCVIPDSPPSTETLQDRAMRAIMRSMPKQKGQRHDYEWNLARRFKSIPEFACATLDELEPYVRQWHTIGVEADVIGSEWYPTWGQFQTDWGNVKVAADQGLMSQIYARAIARPLPKEAALVEGTKTKNIVAFCKALQEENGDKPFFLSCREAGDHVGMSHNYAAAALKQMCHDKILTLVKKGVTPLASEYRYNDMP